MDFPNFISESSFTFDIQLSDEKDYRDSCSNINQIESWKNFPDKKYEIEESGVIIVKKNKKADFNAIARYIWFLYDKKSPFHKQFNSIVTKKANAISCSGIDEKLIEHDEVIEMIVEFLVFQSDKLWSLIETNENVYIEYIQILNTRMDKFSSDKDLVTTLTLKEKVRGYLEAICDDLERQYEKFYAGDKDLKEVVEKRVRLSPESISKKLSR